MARLQGGGGNQIKAGGVKPTQIAILGGDQQGGRFSGHGRCDQSQGLHVGQPVRFHVLQGRDRENQIIFARIVPLTGEFGDVPALGTVSLAARVQPRHPAPAKRIAGRIAIGQVTVKEIRPQSPRQPKREYPHRRKPHPRVVVQISGLRQLGCPFVKAGQSRAPRHRRFHVAAQAAITV